MPSRRKLGGEVFCPAERSWEERFLLGGKKLGGEVHCLEEERKKTGLRGSLPGRKKLVGEVFCLEEERVVLYEKKN